jgi:hypothetical protein
MIPKGSVRLSVKLGLHDRDQVFYCTSGEQKKSCDPMQVKVHTVMFGEVRRYEYVILSSHTFIIPYTVPCMHYFMRFARINRVLTLAKALASAPITATAAPRESGRQIKMAAAVLHRWFPC